MSFDFSVVNISETGINYRHNMWVPYENEEEKGGHPL